MASIRKRTSPATGDVTYQAQIVIKKHGVIVHRESKSFPKKKLAEDWAKRRELELQESDVYKRAEFLRVGDVIQQYIDRFKPDGRSKVFDLTKLQTRDIAKRNAHTLTAKDLIEHVIERNSECKPQTAANDLIWLGTVFKTMNGVIRLETDLSIFDAAREVLRREGMVAKSEQRDRRPTPAELWALSRYFYGKWMLYVMWFAIFSARRQHEIVSIEWEGIDHSKRIVLIRDMKDPRKKGVKRWARLSRSAYKIIEKHGNRKGRVFPYNSKTVGKYFTDACKVLGIEGLHFHDLRHEATSRLFEQGLSIQEVQQITLHQQWSTLQRYCNLRPEDVDV